MRFSFVKSRAFRIGLGVLAALALLLLALKTGIFIGRSRGATLRWGNGYHRLMGSSGNGFLPHLSGPNFITDHSIFGSLVSINGTMLIIKNGSAEQSLLVSGKTVIRRGRAFLALSDLKINDRVIAVGTPNGQGHIEARLIRVLYEPARSSTP